MNKKPKKDAETSPIELKDEEVIFAEEYVRDFNANRAALIAGYSDVNPGKSARLLLNRPHVSRHIDLLIEARAQRLRVDQHWVVENLIDVYTKCMQTQNPLTGEFKAAAPAIKALELLGKHMGMFRERHTHEIVSSFSDEELQKRARLILAKNVIDDSNEKA